ncbi:MAG: replication-relaxation family protein [Bdellovibrionaceae bacterium]|nr:replication-relaxation family protein [Pseudobdellovibrionaceae bacterium]
MRLTKRDLEIFKLISKTAILTTVQIKKMIFTDVATTTVLRRLRKLEKSKYIERIEGLPNHELAWALNLKGADTVGYPNPKRNFHRLSLVHDVKLSDLRLKLEGHGIAHSWIPEHEIRSAMARKHGLKRMQSQFVPDGIMSVKYQGVMESVVIELELHYKNKNRYQDIFQSYIGKNNIKAVWYFVPSESLGKHLEKLWTKYVGNYEPWFFWSLVDDVFENGGDATTHYFDKKFVIGEIFEPLTLAHPSGLGMSNFSDEKTKNKIDVNSENQGELPLKAS